MMKLITRRLSAVTFLAVSWVLAVILLPLSASAQSPCWTGTGSGPVTTNCNVGIGKPIPQYALDVAGMVNADGGVSGFSAVTVHGGWSTFHWIDPYGTVNGGGLWRLGTLGPSNGLALQMNTALAGDFSAAISPMSFSSNGGVSFLGSVGIGFTNPKFPLSVNGTVGATEVVVTAASGLTADYVFQPGYSLTPLAEVSSYIQEHHHLPGIPSEAEVNQNGVGLGTMQAKLLAKIEELTLHMIAAQKENQELRREIQEIKERIAR